MGSLKIIHRWAELSAVFKQAVFSIDCLPRRLAFSIQCFYYLLLDTNPHLELSAPRFEK